MFQTGNTGNDPIAQVKKSDIVVREVEGQGYVLSTEYSDGKPRIGHNRLNVLMDVYAESFDNFFSANDQEECLEIVDIIYDATCGNKDRETGAESYGRQDTTDGCNFHRGRFLVKQEKIVPGTSDIGWEWRKLDEKSSKELIYQTLVSRVEQKRNSILFESADFFDTIDYAGTMDSNDSTKTDSFPRRWQPTLRRSRSATNLTLDAANASSELMNFHNIVDFDGVEDDGVENDNDYSDDDFEPLPIHASRNSAEIRDALRIMNHELNNKEKKRGRRRSLLRRSNSFESAFDKKKMFKIFNKDLPSSKDLPSFIRHDDSADVSTSMLSSNVSRALNYAISYTPQFVSNAFQNEKSSRSQVSNHQGMDIVILADGKTLSADPTIFGNNRIRILLKLERKRFLLLTPEEQKKTAEDLVRVIAKCWKGRILMENEPSYDVLSHEEATTAMSGLLLGDNNNRQSTRAGSMTPELKTISSTSSSSKASSSLLAAAPPLPEFLQAASREILKLGSNKSSKNMTTKERQDAAIEGLKERKKNRQLAKQKNIPDLTADDH